MEIGLVAIRAGELSVRVLTRYDGVLGTPVPTINLYDRSPGSTR